MVDYTSALFLATFQKADMVILTACLEVVVATCAARRSSKFVANMYGGGIAPSCTKYFRVDV